MDRCARTELLIDQCAHCRQLASIEEQAAAHRAALLHQPGWFVAAYPGRCGHCGDPFVPGAAIRRMDSAGDATSTYLAECCTPTPRSTP
jgi:hypothetical protein